MSRCKVELMQPIRRNFVLELKRFCKEVKSVQNAYPLFCFLSFSGYIRVWLVWDLNIALLINQSNIQKVVSLICAHARWCPFILSFRRLSCILLTSLQPKTFSKPAEILESFRVPMILQSPTRSNPTLLQTVFQGRYRLKQIILSF